MNVLSLDTETPKFDKVEVWRGNVYGDPRPPVCWSMAGTKVMPWAFLWEEDSVEVIQNNIGWADLVVGFNLKHDVAYLRREGVDFSNVRIWDVQLAEFVLGRQLNKFPSLNDTCVRYGIPTKLDVVKSEYWDKGVDTHDIPWPVLSEYAAHDASVTLAAYHKQLPLLTPAQKVLVSLMSQDMLVLQEMEKNGITYNEKLCEEQGLKLDDEIRKIELELSRVYPHVPINFGSNDDLSTFLYGGTIVETTKVHDGYFKSGIKKGQPKLKNVEVEYNLPRLFVPLKGSELLKAGFFETNEPTLQKLKPLDKKNGYVVAMLLRLAKLSKLNGTYYRGLPKLNKAMHWPPGKLHGNLNQTQAVTGRISSNKPNQQNMASELQDIFVSEYD